MRDSPNPLSSKTTTGCCEDGSNHIKIHRSWRSVYPELFFALIISLTTYRVLAYYEIASVPLDLAQLGLSGQIKLPLPLLIFLVLIARPVALMFNCQHELGCHHAKTVTGLTSFKREQVEVPYEDVLGVRFNQRFLERFLDVGTILAWTASADQPELVMNGIGEPEQVAKLIKDKMDHALIEATHRHDPTAEST